jgi:hypothetical protein
MTYKWKIDAGAMRSDDERSYRDTATGKKRKSDTVARCVLTMTDSTSMHLDT